MIKKKIILTFDYEMFLGNDSGSIEKCMIEPTNRILDILKKFDAKGLFFVDATFLKILKKDYFVGYLKIKDQILDILKSGSDIGLHIHPHWIDSFQISINKWSFKTYENFRIHNLPNKIISSIINDSFKELDHICKEFSDDYKIDSFRAGGWSIQPFSLIKYDLKKIGIKYDFSVLPGMKKDNLPKHYYDFKKAPKKDFWKFEDDVLKYNSEGSFIELPVSIFKILIFDVIKLKINIKNYQIIGDGKGADDSGKSFISKLKKLKLFIAYALSSDYMQYDIFIKYFNNIKKDLLIYVAHPKLFSDESFKILEFICNQDIISYKSIKNDIK